MRVARTGRLALTCDVRRLRILCMRGSLSTREWMLVRLSLVGALLSRMLVVLCRTVIVWGRTSVVMMRFVMVLVRI